jgi:hypothetical protein
VLQPANPKTVNNHLTLFISVLNAAVDLGWLAKVPRIKKPKVRLISADYRYLRTTEERDAFLRAAQAEPSRFSGNHERARSLGVAW